MSFELMGSFSPEFFFNEGEPYDAGEPSEEPTSVWQAIISMDEEEWAFLAKEVFEVKPEFLTPETVLEKIQQTDTVTDLRSPVEVWIDDGGYHTVRVYDRQDNPKRRRKKTAKKSRKKGGVKRKRKWNPKDWTPIGIVGDVNPIEHWGGIVYETPYGIEMLYFQETEGTVYVHRVDIEDDVAKDLNWVDWKDIASFTGVDVADLKKAGRSDNALARAQVYEAVAGYHGWSEFDDQPEVLTLEEAENKYGADADRAHQKRNPRRRKKTAKRRGKKGVRRNRNVDRGHPEYHRRNLILDEELVQGVMEWHGGQNTMTYSLGSTGMSDYVSPSMIDAAVDELESIKPSGKAEKKELEELIGELDARARFSDEFTTKEAGVGDVDSGYATWLMEDDDPMANPKKKRSKKKTAKRKTAKKKSPRCKKGQIKVKRKGYTTKDGTRVKGSQFCIKDRGNPGRGPDIVPEIKEGTLGGPGYTTKSAAARHRLLSTCVKKYGYESCLGKLNYLAVVGKDTWSKSKLAKVDADRNWLVKKYGGPGSFGPEKKKGRKRNTHDVSKSERKFVAAVKAADRELTDAVGELADDRVGASVNHLVRASFFAGEAGAERRYMTGPVSDETKSWEKRFKEIEAGAPRWGKAVDNWLKHGHDPQSTKKKSTKRKTKKKSAKKKTAKRRTKKKATKRKR